jgi:hypothetical protein
MYKNLSTNPVAIGWPQVRMRSYFSSLSHNIGLKSIMVKQTCVHAQLVELSSINFRAWFMFFAEVPSEKK